MYVRLLGGLRRLLREQHGTQTVEWLALGLLVLALLGVFGQAVGKNKSLPTKFTAAVGRLVERAVPND